MTSRRSRQEGTQIQGSNASRHPTQCLSTGRSGLPERVRQKPPEPAAAPARSSVGNPPPRVRTGLPICPDPETRPSPSSGSSPRREALGMPPWEGPGRPPRAARGPASPRDTRTARLRTPRDDRAPPPESSGVWLPDRFPPRPSGPGRLSSLHPAPDTAPHHVPQPCPHTCDWGFRSGWTLALARVR